MFSKKEDDVNSMEKKMNKILKRKKYKENYKNIQELNNIYETNHLSKTEEKEDKKPKIEDFSGRKKHTVKKSTAATATAINPISSTDKGSGKAVIENFEDKFDAQINNFKDQIDQLSSKIRENLSSISEKILDLITAVPNRLDNILHSILLQFVMIMNNIIKEDQNNPNTYEDVNVLKSLIYSFVAFPLLCLYVIIGYIGLSIKMN